MSTAFATRVASTYGALGIAIALVAAVTATASSHAVVIGSVGSAGVAMLLIGVARRVSQFVLAAVVFVGAAFALADGFAATLRAAALPYGIGLFLLCELGFSSAADHGSRTASLPGIDRTRVSYLMLVVVSTLVTGFVAFAVVGTSRGGSLLELCGVVVATALIVNVVVLVRRRGNEEGRASPELRDGSAAP